jgi:protein-S-isoprenylcysteine O-methyltransferase Ste14
MQAARAASTADHKTGRHVVAYWTGLVLAAIAAAFLVAGWRRRQAVRAERVALGYAPNDDTPQRRDPYSSITILGDSMPPIVVAALAFVGVKAVFFYLALGGGLFTVVDLAGFLMLLGGYGAWMWWHSRYRFAETGTQAPAARQPAEQAASAAAPGRSGDGPDDAPSRRRAA